MTEPVSNNTAPIAPPVEPFEIGKKDSKDVQGLKLKTNEAIQNSKVDLAGNQMRPPVDVAKGIQVPQ